MTTLTTQQFIAGYLESPTKTMEWISQNSNELMPLFTMRDDFELLALAYNQKLAATASNVSLPIFGGFRTPEYLQQIKELGEPIDVLLHHSGARLASLYEDSTQFMQLFVTCPAMAKKLFEKEPAKIGSLFVSHAHFMQLLNSDTSLAIKLFENEPTRIGSFFETYDQFIQLHDKTPTLAEKLLDSNPNRFAVLFNTQCKLERLYGTSLLRSKVAAIRDSLGLQFEKQAAETYQLESECIAPFSNSDASSFDSELFRKRMMQKFELQNKANPPVLKRQPLKPNNNFCLECLIGLALAGGIAAIIAGALLAQPELLGVGLGVTIAAAISLFSHFAKKPAETYDDSLDFVNYHR
ncbi:MAG: hypothetical protein H0U75_08990 [Legionella sp.]|nr:hypothetical protein [Legionella sp.]